MTLTEDISEPGLFLDLPPTLPPAADVDLDFISRMLMEEDIDDKFFYHINAATTSSFEDTNYSSWPYDPLELSQLLRSPPYLDDMVVDGFVPDSPADEDARNSSRVPAAGFQQSPAQFKGAADGASANGGSPGTQNSAILNGPAEEKEAKPKPAMFSAGDGG
ncbi:hypothetical protein D1007_20840 [Hordeum vulgare]|nr:hypothetical protein D1007_20840 [Hordeum vulgare]